MTNNTLRNIRACLHLSQRGMADELGVPFGTYRKWESGATVVKSAVRLMLDVRRLKLQLREVRV